VWLGNGEPGAGSPPEWQGESAEATEEQLQSVHVNLHFERPWKAGPQAFNVSANVFKKLGAKHSVIVSVIQVRDSTADRFDPVYFSGLVHDPAVVARGNSSQLDVLETVKSGRSTF